MSLHVLPHLTVETGNSPRASIIWLHGLGADGHDFEPIVPQLSLPEDLHIRFIFPHAPAMPVTLNGGYIMPAWYDIKHGDFGIEHDEAGIRHSAKAVEMFVEREIMHGIPPSHIILAGFSQGGSMALHVGLRQGEALAGIMALSSYLLLPDKLDAETIQANRDTPILMAHGVEDPVVPFALGDTTRRTLESAGYEVEWHTYPMQHSVCPEEIAAIGKWIKNCLG
ncbi:MAG: alpha/beta hydrolase [Mariprofundaceae bacterium]